MNELITRQLTSLDQLESAPFGSVVLTVRTDKDWAYRAYQKVASGIWLLLAGPKVKRRREGFSHGTLLLEVNGGRLSPLTFEEGFVYLAFTPLPGTVQVRFPYFEFTNDVSAEIPNARALKSGAQLDLLPDQTFLTVIDPVTRDKSTSRYRFFRKENGQYLEHGPSIGPGALRAQQIIDAAANKGDTRYSAASIRMLFSPPPTDKFGARDRRDLEAHMKSLGKKH